MSREATVARILADAPESAKNCMKKAYEGIGGRSNAIKAMCLSCTGFDRGAVRECTGYSCPLWAYRPFK